MAKIHWFSEKPSNRKIVRQNLGIGLANMETAEVIAEGARAVLAPHHASSEARRAKTGRDDGSRSRIETSMGKRKVDAFVSLVDDNGGGAAAIEADLHPLWIGALSVRT